ncbi:MAG: phosphohydrolase, partial [Deltaproteobacteria bacterium]|nr:phosphohydrolase [Deltaproteobacteria bacterium]
MHLRCFAFAIIIATAVLAAPAPCAAQVRMASPRVLVIHSYAPDFSWTRDLHAGIVSVLQSSTMWADYRVEYMDAKHYTSPAYQQRFLGLLRDKYAGARFDGVILTDNHALDLVARYREEFFPRTPIVTCGVNDPESIPDNADDMNIIIESAAHRETLEVALRQNPDTRKIFVLIDNTLTGQSILRGFQDQARFLTDRVEIEVLPPLAQDDLIRFARECSPGELIYLLVYFEDAVGKVFQAEEIPRAVATN